MTELDVVALLEDLPSRCLLKGQVGTIVEKLGDEHFLVEFSDVSGKAYAVEPIAAFILMGLRYSPEASA